MAISRPTISSAITQRATDLLENARKYCNNDSNLNEAYVSIEVLKGTQKVLNKLCGKAISDNSTRAGIESILKKAQNKLQRAEQLNTFLRSENRTDVDPRVERIMKKIADQKLTSYAPSQTNTIHKKLTKWDAILRTCSRVSNELSKQTAASARSSISEIEMELLQHAPHIIAFNHGLRSRFNDEFYKPSVFADRALPNREECIKLASAFYAKRYLISFASSRLDNHRFDNDGSDRDIGDQAHRSTNAHLKIFGFCDVIPAQHLFPGTNPEYLNAVPFPASFSCKEISFPSNANVDEVQKQIDNLIALKNAHCLNWISAFIEIKPQMLAIVLHLSGRISLLNPCGSKTNSDSYEANFANSKQAAEFLKNLIGEMGTNNPIVFKPYSEAGAIPETEETTSSSSSSSSSSSALDLPIDIDVDPFARLPSSPRSSSSPSSSTQHKAIPRINIDSFTAALRKRDETSGDDSDVETDDEPEQKPSTSTAMFPRMTAIKASIQALSERNNVGFFQSISHLLQLKENYWTWTDGSNCSTLDRVNFHLYHIQDKETPDKIDRNDSSWGMTALLTEALSTPDQKLRAVQRVRVEELLHSLQTLIHRGEFGTEDFVQLLDELEQLQLNPSDLPSGQNNAAHALFGKFYQVYTKAREQDPSLADPNDEMFKGDFGRHAFTGDFGIENSEKIKIEALKELAKDFQAAWRI